MSINPSATATPPSLLAQMEPRWWKLANSLVPDRRAQCGNAENKPTGGRLQLQFKMIQHPPCDNVAQAARYRKPVQVSLLNPYFHGHISLWGVRLTAVEACISQGDKRKKGVVAADRI